MAVGKVGTNKEGLEWPERLLGVFPNYFYLRYLLLLRLEFVELREA